MKKNLMALVLLLAAIFGLSAGTPILPYELTLDLTIDRFYENGFKRQRVDEETFKVILPEDYVRHGIEKDTDLYICQSTNGVEWFQAKIETKDHLSSKVMDEKFSAMVGFVSESLGRPMDKGRSDELIRHYMTPMTPQEKVKAFRDKNPAALLINKYVGARMKSQYDFTHPEWHELWADDEMIVLVRKKESSVETVIYNLYALRKEGNSEVPEKKTKR